jgi:hypothetical protein
VGRAVAIRLDRQGGKEIHVDGKNVRDRLQLIENIPCILFSHQDLETVTGSPEMRRRFFNQVLGLFDPLFVSLLRAYRRALKARNLLLGEAGRDLLAAAGRSLAELGLRIRERRAQVVEEFNRTLTPLFGRVSGLEEEVRIQYRPCWRGPCGEVEKGWKALPWTCLRGHHQAPPGLPAAGAQEFHHLTGQVRLGSAGGWPDRYQARWLQPCCSRTTRRLTARRSAWGDPEYDTLLHFPARRAVPGPTGPADPGL